MTGGLAARFWERFGGPGYGADYNPEQWPPEVWRDDVKLMREAGVNIVSLGIFAWAWLEPAPGRYEFGWLDEVMGLLHEAGVAVCLATATASPPPWLSRLHPETLPVTQAGVRLGPGSRQHFCPSSARYREAARQLAGELARRYGRHPALALWHVGNEFGCHVPACYCDESAADFRRWLRQRYGSLAALNESWSTAFWSQRYGDWEEISPPRQAPTFCNPAQQLDFARFSSDALLACYQSEREVLRQHTPDVPVTTNLLSLWKPLDYFAWAPSLDVIAHDSYPDPADLQTVTDAAFNYDLMRSLGGGRPWVLMEQAPSAVNWRARNSPKPPGLMRLWSCQALARGADAVMFFQWRASAGGAEKFHSAMVPHGGTETRTWREISAFGRELAGLAPVTGSQVAADAAIVIDWPSWWALELDSRPSAALRLGGQLRRHYAALWQDGITADVVRPDADLSRYRLVVVPNLYLVSDAAAASLRDYTAAGGHLVMSFFSGIVDECDRVRLGGYPAAFRDLLGLGVDEFWPLAEGEELAAAFTSDGAPLRASLWADVIEPEGAEVLAAYAAGPQPGPPAGAAPGPPAGELPGPLAGAPAITRHRFGSGTAWYLGTRPDAGGMRRVMREAAAGAGLTPAVAGLPPGTEAVWRHGTGSSFLFLLNHGGGPATVGLPGPMTGVFGDVPAADGLTGVTLPPRGAAVLRAQAAQPVNRTEASG